MSSLYNELPVDLLASFHYEIKKNIEKGILTAAMYFEINLIEQAAKVKGIAIEELHNYRMVY